MEGKGRGGGGGGPPTRDRPGSPVCGGESAAPPQGQSEACPRVGWGGRGHLSLWGEGRVDRKQRPPPPHAQGPIPHPALPRGIRALRGLLQSSLLASQPRTWLHVLSASHRPVTKHSLGVSTSGPLLQPFPLPGVSFLPTATWLRPPGRLQCPLLQEAPLM